MITDGRLLRGASRRHARTTGMFLGFVACIATLANEDVSAQYRSLYYEQILTPGMTVGSSLVSPTALAIAPDGRLFVAQLNGMIHYMTLDANGHVVPGSVGRIDTIYNRGFSLPPYTGGRVVTGLAFQPGTGHLVVSHSDARLYDANITQGSGMLTKLYAPGFTSAQDLMWNLPRSQRDHGPNGMAFGPDGYIYLAQAGMTNAGLPSPSNFWNFSETTDSGSILHVYPDYPMIYSTWATGLRNPYKPLFHSNGALYTNDNGPNSGAGTRPIGGGNCGDSGITPDTPDELNQIVQNGYYGHPNPARGQCDFGAGTGPVFTYGLHTSSNGLAEYTSTNVNALPALQAHIFTANYTTGSVVSVRMVGTSVIGTGPQRYGFGNPLDVAISSLGNIYVAEHSGNVVSALRPMRTIPLDFDSDRRSDMTIYRPSQGTWYYYSPGSGLTLPINSGSSVDIPRPTDYDGDAKQDAVSWNPNTGLWTIKQSSTGGVVQFYHGSPGDIPITADFEGDARGDQAIFRPSNGVWYVRYANTGTIIGYQWGQSGDIPRVMDIDGDGKTDLAVFRPSSGQWWILPYGSIYGPYNPSNGYTFTTWGQNGDIPVPADYDGDGRTDIAIFRPSTGQWWILPASGGFNSANGYTVVGWGQSGDSPRPLDWDGDGRADIVVWRPSNGTWYVILASQGFNPAYGFTHWHGDPTDIAVDNAF